MRGAPGADPEREIAALRAEIARLSAARDAAEEALAAERTERERAEREARQRQSLLQEIIDHAPHTITVQDLAEGRYLLANRKQASLLGREPDEIVGRTIEELIPGQAARWREEDRRIAASGQPLQIEDSKRNSLDGDRYFLGLKFPLRDAAGSVYAIGGIFQEITERKQIERALEQSEARYRAVIAALEEGVIVLDAAGVIVSANASAARLLGVPIEHLRDRPLTNAHPAAIDEAGQPFALTAHPARLALGDGAATPGATIGLPQTDGAIRWLTLAARPLLAPGANAPGGAVCSIVDVTARRAHEQELHHRAAHDPLTGLPNRAGFHAALDQALAAGRDPDRLVGVLFLDLDRFKQVNDRLGHAAGDQLLIDVAARLRAALRGDETAARLGGDEFILCLPHLTRADEATARAAEILAALRQPYPLAETTVTVTPSIGITLARPGLQTAERLIRRADAALYRAKAAGRATYAVAATTTGDLGAHRPPPSPRPAPLPTTAP